MKLMSNKPEMQCRRSQLPVRFPETEVWIQTGPIRMYSNVIGRRRSSMRIILTSNNKQCNLHLRCTTSRITQPLRPQIGRMGSSHRIPGWPVNKLSKRPPETDTNHFRLISIMPQPTGHHYIQDFLVDRQPEVQQQLVNPRVIQPMA